MEDNSMTTPDPKALEALKQEAVTEFMKGRNSKDLRDLAFEIVSETFNWLRMKNHLHAQSHLCPDLASVREALEFYGDEGNYPLVNGGKRARKALADLKKMGA